MMETPDINPNTSAARNMRQRVFRRIGQILIGFVLINLLTLLNFQGLHHVTFSIYTIGMGLAGFGLGSREQKPLLMVLCLHLTAVIGTAIIAIFDNPSLFPNTFPVLEITSSLATYLGILIRQRRIPLRTSVALVASLMLFALSMTLYALPIHLYQNRNEPMAVPGAGIKLIGLNTADITLPLKGKKVVVFDFWNTVCLYCFQSKHELIALAETWRHDDRVLIASMASAVYDSLDEVKASDYLTLPGSGSMPEYYDPTGKLAQIIAPHGCPIVGFVDESGLVVYRHRGYEIATRGVYRRLLDQKIREMLEDA